MKQTAKIARLVGLVVLLAAPLNAMAQPHVGVWTTIDPNDGSRAYIGVNAEWQIVFYDTDATFGCRSGGGGPFFAFDDNYGDSVELIGDVLVGYLEGVCQNGAENQNTSFGFGMRHFPETDTVRSRNAVWNRTFIDEEEFVANAFVLKRLSPLTTRGSIWDFMGSYGGDDPQIIPGADCLVGNLSSGDKRQGCYLFGLSLAPEYPWMPIHDVSLRETVLFAGHLLAHLNDSDLTGVDMASAGLIGSMRNVSLRWADLRKTIFYPWEYLFPLDSAFEGSYYLEDVDFTGTDLRGIIVRRAHQTGRRWKRINFTKADLTGAIFDVGQSPVDEDSVIFRNTTCPDGTNSNDNGGTCDLTWSPP